MPSRYVASQYPYTYVDPEPNGGQFKRSVSGTSHTANGPRLTEEAATDGNVVDARANVLVPARDDNASKERVLVLIAELVEERCCYVYGGRLACLLADARG